MDCKNFLRFYRFHKKIVSEKSLYNKNEYITELQNLKRAFLWNIYQTLLEHNSFIIFNHLENHPNFIVI